MNYYEIITSTYGDYDKTVLKWTEATEELFEEFHIDYRSTHGVERNVIESLGKKASLVELLRKSKYWDEAGLRIVMPVKIKREISYYTINDRLYDLKFCFFDSYKSTYELRQDPLYCAVSNIRDIILCDECISSTVTENQIELIKAYNLDIKASVGQKWSRIVRKFFNGMIPTDATDEWRHKYEKAFADFADAINPLDLTQKAIIGLGVWEFLTMSYGNSWRSCHYINPDNYYPDGKARGGYHEGIYKAGCLSYGNDDVSMLVYVLPADANEDDIPFYWQPKIRRMVCCYKNGCLLQSRGYPSSDSNVVKSLREIVQSVITECLGVPNLWTVNKSHGDWFTKGGALHYPDYIHDESYDGQQNNIHTCMVQNYNRDTDVLYAVGGISFDIYSGEILSTEGILSCRECYRNGNNVVHCCHCGESIELDEYGEWECMLNGRYYCEYCYEDHVFYCEHCDEHYDDTYVNHYLTADEVRLCEHCYDRQTTTCDHCGLVFYTPDGDLFGSGLTYTEDEHLLCRGCYNHHTTTCTDCRETFYLATSLREDPITGELRCGHCHEHQMEIYMDAGLVDEDGNLIKEDSEENAENEDALFDIGA